MTSIKKWNYKAEVIRHKSFGGVDTEGLEEILNEYGAEGYELVSVCELDVHIFKKPTE